MVVGWGRKGAMLFTYGLCGCRGCKGCAKEFTAAWGGARLDKELDGRSGVTAREIVDCTLCTLGWMFGGGFAAAEDHENVGPSSFGRCEEA